MHRIVLTAFAAAILLFAGCGGGETYIYKTVPDEPEELTASGVVECLEEGGAVITHKESFAGFKNIGAASPNMQASIVISLGEPEGIEWTAADYKLSARPSEEVVVNEDRTAMFIIERVDGRHPTPEDRQLAEECTQAI